MRLTRSSSSNSSNGCRQRCGSDLSVEKKKYFQGCPHCVSVTLPEYWKFRIKNRSRTVGAALGTQRANQEALKRCARPTSLTLGLPTISLPTPSLSGPGFYGRGVWHRRFAPESNRATQPQQS